MTAMRLDQLRQYSDILRTRSGEALTVRFVEPRDAEELRHYFRSLSMSSRYNRFFRPVSEVPSSLLEQFIHVGEADRFSVVATMRVDGFEKIVGEACYVFHGEDASIEFALSISNNWQGHGIGKAILRNLECRAASFGAHRIYGDTLHDNKSMIALARRAGYGFTNSPVDWTATRFEKHVDAEPRGIPCATWRLEAIERQQAAHAAPKG